MKVLKLASGLLSLVMLVSVAACSNTHSEAEDKFADKEAIATIQDGLEKRFDFLYTNTSDNAKNLKKAIRIEIDNDKELKKKKYKNSKLQETVISYVNVLDESLAVVENNGYGSSSFYEEWNKVYDKRTSIIRTLSDKYRLTMGEKYQDDFKDLLANGNSVSKKQATDEAIKSLFSNATFEKTNDGYGNIEYSAVIENTSEYSFENVQVILSLYDASGVKEKEEYASTNSWEKGEKVKFDAYSTVDASRVQAEVEMYEVVE